MMEAIPRGGTLDRFITIARTDSPVLKAQTCCVISEKRGKLSFAELLNRAREVRADGDFSPVEERAAYLSVMPEYRWSLKTGNRRVDDTSLQFPTMSSLAREVLPGSFKDDFWQYPEGEGPEEVEGAVRSKGNYPHSKEGEPSRGPIAERVGELRSLLQASSTKYLEFVEKGMNLGGAELEDFLCLHTHLFQFIRWFATQYPNKVSSTEHAPKLIDRRRTPIDLDLPPFTPQTRAKAVRAS